MNVTFAEVKVPREKVKAISTKKCMAHFKCFIKRNINSFQLCIQHHVMCFFFLAAEVSKQSNKSKPVLTKRGKIKALFL